MESTSATSVGSSILMSSAPRSASRHAHIGPAQVVVASTTRTPASGPGRSCRASRKKAALSMVEAPSSGDERKKPKGRDSHIGLPFWSAENRRQCPRDLSLDLQSERVASWGHIADRWRGEVGSHNEFAVVAVPFEERAARGRRLLRICAEPTAPLRFSKFYRMVHHVASQDGLFPTILHVYTDMTRCMSRRGFEPHLVIDRMISRDEHGLLRFDDRDYAISNRTIPCLTTSIVFTLPELPFFLSKEVLCIREGWYPFAVH